jgi:peptidyl-prolyl cis-trans isomerase C
MMMIHSKWLLMGIFLTGFCFGTGINPNPLHGENTPAKLLASVGDQAITTAAFQAAISRRPGRLSSPPNKEALLKKMVRFEMLYAAARQAGYEKDPAIIEKVRRLIANIYRKNVLEPRLAELQVTEGELESYYNDHRAEFTSSTMVRAAVIQITIPARSSEEKKSRLADRAAAARTAALQLDLATRSFGPVAVQYSDHQPTRYRGGDTGWLKAGKNDRRWPETVNRSVFSQAEPGTVSPVITTPGGYYIVKLMETQKSAPRTLTAVKEQIRHRLFLQKREQVESEFYEELKGRIPVMVDRSVLESIKPAAGDSAMNAKQPPGLPGE